MCGVAGVFGGAGASSAVAMADALRHRGPDDHALADLRSAGGEGAGAFGHCRLAILDLSTGGRQPMTYAAGRYTLVFNGEIYNFRALRDELRREGATFRGESDSEVVLAGWALHGPSFLPRLRGMFAFALWDAERATGVLARDRFGIKPLYVAERDGVLLFASEVRAMLRAGIEPRLSIDAVASYLATGSVAEPLTIIEGVRQLEAGTVTDVTVRGGRAVLGGSRVFAEPLAREEREPERNAAAARRMVREALRDSVAHHLVSDVPVGAFLSGGIDSSAVVALASDAASEPLATFTMTFDEVGYDEAGPARALARRFGTRHHEVPLRGADLLAALPDAFAAMDQPSMDGLNTYVVSRAVRAHGLKVVLSGLGGDEMFAGYPSFARAATLRRLRRLPAAARWAVASVAAASDVRTEKLRAALADGAPARAAYVASRMLFGPRQVKRLGARGYYLTSTAPADLSTLQQVSWYELTGYMRSTLLRDSDVFSMAHGLELRVPFIDERVARATAAVDDRLKLRRGRSKPLLTSALEDLLPREVWDRPKRGFTLPFERWMRGPMRTTIDAELGGPWAERVGISAPAAREVWQTFLDARAGVSWSRPWALYTLVRWAREHGVVVGSKPPLTFLAERPSLASLA